MGCGVNPDQWWAKGSGAAMELGRCLEPLAPLRAKLNVVNGLFNKHATGVGIHPGQTGNILSGAALQKGAELKGGISVDQVLARHLGEETDQPSMVLGLRAADHRLPRDQLLDGLQLAHLLAERHLARADGGLPVAGVRRPVRQPRDQAQPSILDRVRAEAAGLRRRVSAGDRAKLDEYLTSVREVERRVAPMRSEKEAGRRPAERPGPPRA